jgi:hypothetical protein
MHNTLKLVLNVQNHQVMHKHHETTHDPCFYEKKIVTSSISKKTLTLIASDLILDQFHQPFAENELFLNA